MSKGNYKRKRHNTAKHAKESADPTPIQNGVIVGPEQSRQTADDLQQHTKSKKDRPMTLSELLNRSSFTDWLVAVFTLALTVTTVFQYALTVGQLDVLRNDERAWLQVKALDFSVGEKERFENTVVEHAVPTWNLKLSNVGKTPARRITAVYDIKVLGHAQAVPLDCVQISNKSCSRSVEEVGSLFPNAESDSPMSASRLPDATHYAEFTKEEVDSWSNGDSYIAVFGVITYEDIFHTDHWTHFCYWRSKAGYQGKTFTAQSCSHFNGED